MDYIEVKTGHRWTFVGAAPDAQGTMQVLLRRADGTQGVFEQQALPPHSGARFSVAAESASGVSAAEVDALKETLLGVRHTSAIRFVALPIFVAASGALGNTLLEGDSYRMHGFDVIALSGLFLSIVFCVFDIVLSRNLIRMWEAVKRLAHSAPWKAVFAQREQNDRGNVMLWLVRYTLFLPYALGTGFWSLRVWADTPWAGGAALLLSLLFSAVVWWRAHSASP